MNDIKNKLTKDYSDNLIQVTHCTGTYMALDGQLKPSEYLEVVIKPDTKSIARVFNFFLENNLQCSIKKFDFFLRTTVY